MKNTKTHDYPTWHLLWSTPTRITLRIISGVIFFTILFALTKQQWLLNIILLPLFLIFLVYSGSEKFKRGYVPEIIRKRMTRDFSDKLSDRYEALYTLKRVYERSAAISKPKPRDLWLSKHYVNLAFSELAKSEQDNPNAYNDLRNHIFKSYYRK